MATEDGTTLFSNDAAVVHVAKTILLSYAQRGDELIKYAEESSNGMRVDEVLEITPIPATLPSFCPGLFGKMYRVALNPVLSPFSAPKSSMQIDEFIDSAARAREVSAPVILRALMYLDVAISFDTRNCFPTSETICNLFGVSVVIASQMIDGTSSKPLAEAIGLASKNYNLLEKTVMSSLSLNMCTPAEKVHDASIAAMAEALSVGDAHYTYTLLSNANIEGLHEAMNRVSSWSPNDEYASESMFDGGMLRRNEPATSKACTKLRYRRLQHARRAVARAQIDRDFGDLLRDPKSRCQVTRAMSLLSRCDGNRLRLLIEVIQDNSESASVGVLERKPSALVIFSHKYERKDEIAAPSPKVRYDFESEWPLKKFNSLDARYNGSARGAMRKTKRGDGRRAGNRQGENARILFSTACKGSSSRIAKESVSNLVSLDSNVFSSVGSFDGSTGDKVGFSSFDSESPSSMEVEATAGLKVQKEGSVRLPVDGFGHGLEIVCSMPSSGVSDDQCTADSVLMELSDEARDGGGYDGGGYHAGGYVDFFGEAGLESKC